MVIPFSTQPITTTTIKFNKNKKSTILHSKREII